MVTIDNMLVDSFPPEMLQDLVNAVDTIENGLQGEKKKNDSMCNKWQMLKTVWCKNEFFLQMKNCTTFDGTNVIN